MNSEGQDHSRSFQPDETQLSPPLPGSNGHSHDPDDPSAQDLSKTRLRKACDSCSIRKIKCDESGPPCQPCATLNIPCTWNRPTRRRGPPNRHAEALKRQRLDSDTSSPSSPTHAAQTLTALARSHVLSAESICPLLLLYPLIDDYFTYIHPLVPIPHEPTFREALNRRDDLHDPTFLSLVASMISALIVSFPRKPRLHLKAQGQESLFPKSMNLVERCHQVALEARGTGFLIKHHQLYDAATSYLLALTMGYTMRWRDSVLYFNECLWIIHSLGIHKSTDGPMSSQLKRPDSSEGISYIHRELGRRLFWVVFVGVRSFHHAGLSPTDLFILPAMPQYPYPPLALEVDDRYLFRDRIEPQPPDVISELVGFNANVRLYRSYDDVANLDLMLGIGWSGPWEYQTQVIHRALQICKTALNDVPPELQLLQPGQQSANFGSDLVSAAGSPRTPGSARRHGPVSPSQHWETDHTSVQRRRLQYEIQKANIYVTQLGTRSHIVDRYWGLYDAHKAQTGEIVDETTDPIAADMAAERELIVRDLLVVLRSVSQVNMEPNGFSLIQKIRSIASTLLDVPRSRKGTLALRAQDYLMELVDVLMKLERIPSARVSRTDKATVSQDANMLTPDTPHSWGEEDDEAELEHWADIRDVQKRFADSGGVLEY